MDPIATLQALRAVNLQDYPPEDICDIHALALALAKDAADLMTLAAGRELMLRDNAAV